MKIQVNDGENEAVIEFDREDIANNPTTRLAAMLAPTLGRLLNDGGSNRPYQPSGNGDMKHKMILTMKTEVVEL